MSENIESPRSEKKLSSAEKKLSKQLKLASGKSKMSKMCAVMPQSGIQKRKKSRIIRKGLKNYIKKSKKPEVIEEEVMDVGEGFSSKQIAEEPPKNEEANVAKEDNVEMKIDAQDDKEMGELYDVKLEDIELPKTEIKTESMQPEDKVEEKAEPQGIDQEELPVEKNKPTEALTEVNEEIPKEDEQHLIFSFKNPEYDQLPENEVKGDSTDKIETVDPVPDGTEIKGMETETDKQVDENVVKDGASEEN